VQRGRISELTEIRDGRSFGAGYFIFGIKFTINTHYCLVWFGTSELKRVSFLAMVAEERGRYVSHFDKKSEALADRGRARLKGGAHNWRYKLLVRGSSISD